MFSSSLLLSMFAHYPSDRASVWLHFSPLHIRDNFLVDNYNCALDDGLHPSLVIHGWRSITWRSNIWTILYHLLRLFTWLDPGLPALFQLTTCFWNAACWNTFSEPRLVRVLFFFCCWDSIQFFLSWDMFNYLYR